MCHGQFSYFFGSGSEGDTVLCGRYLVIFGLKRYAAHAARVAGWRSGQGRLPAVEEIVAGSRAQIYQGAVRQMLQQTVVGVGFEHEFGIFLNIYLVKLVAILPDVGVDAESGGVETLFGPADGGISV